jgi:hypothetical protein
MIGFQEERIFYSFRFNIFLTDRLCNLVVWGLATDPEAMGSIPGSTRFSEK